MGRKKIYQTNEDLIIAKRKWRSRYYYKNKNQINNQLMRKYYERKKIISND